MSLLKKNLGGIKIYLTIQMSLTFPALCCGVRAPRVRGAREEAKAGTRHLAFPPATWHFPRHLASPWITEESPRCGQAAPL